MTSKRLLIRGGQVYDHDGDVHKPAVADILIEDDKIASVGSSLAVDGPHEVIDATGRLVVPGLINAHYHSHDTLCRGLFEELPLEMWLLYTLPMGANRSKEELRARTLVGAVESLHCGITTVQDMLGLVPLDDARHRRCHRGLSRGGNSRGVFAHGLGHSTDRDGSRTSESLPPDVQEMLGTKGRPIREQFDYLEHQFKRHAAGGTLHWAVAPFAPQRCSPEDAGGLRRARAQARPCRFTPTSTRPGVRSLIARELFADHDGSLIDYMDSVGLLGPRLNIVHSVWISRREMDRMAAADAGIVLNPLSNLKLKSGVPPVCDMREAGVRLGVGCDNCSGSDVQNVFQAMKMFCLLAAVSEPEPGPHLAHEVLRHATIGNARTAGLGGRLGAIRPGYKADLILIDLNDAAYLPYNSAARQLVYTEAGRGVESVIVDGRVVMKERRLTTLDEDALRREVAGLMRHFIADYDAIVESRKRALPYMKEAHRRVWQAEIGVQRFIGRTR